MVDDLEGWEKVHGFEEYGGKFGNDGLDIIYVVGQFRGCVWVDNGLQREME